MEIILIRHGKPIIPSLKKISPLAFSEWVGLYNLSSLCDASKPPVEAVRVASTCKAIVCSELVRSIESAKALEIKTVTLISSKFNEADLPVASWRFPRLSPKIWAVIFRVLWFFGYSRNAESFHETKERATEAASILKELAETYTTVLFIGHGVYNRMLANELNSTGWSGPKNPGSKHWSFGVYKYKKE